MTEKMKIVYIGPNAQKKVSRGLIELTFPRGEAVTVSEQIGYELLKCDDVFATPENAADVIKKNEEHEETLRTAAEEQRKLKAMQEASETYVVIVDGQKIDISKFTRPKLTTIVAAEQLSIDVNAPEIKEGEAQAEALRNRVRDALHKKHGNPELDEAKG